MDNKKRLITFALQRTTVKEKGTKRGHIQINKHITSHKY